MIGTIEYVQILDKTDQLSTMILQSDVMREYEEAWIALEKDAQAQQYINTFTHIKEQYEEVQRFGRYHPDYADIMKNIRKAKRNMDMHETVAAFKLAERNVQRFLDEISELIAKSVSEHIMVPKEDGLFTDGSCSTGGCGTGGSCGCKVS